MKNPKIEIQIKILDIYQIKKLKLSIGRNECKVITSMFCWQFNKDISSNIQNNEDIYIYSPKCLRMSNFFINNNYSEICIYEEIKVLTFTPAEMLQWP